MIKENFQYVITEYKYDDISSSIKEYIDLINETHNFNIKYCISKKLNVYKENVIHITIATDDQYQMGNIKRLLLRLFKK